MRWKTICFNASVALNSLLVFLVLMETLIVIPPWLQSVGRMHPLLLHFPIVLIVLSACFEIVIASKKLPAFPGKNFGDGLLLITSLTAALSAVMGLLLSREEGYSSDTLFWHKLGGVVLSLLALGWYIVRDFIRIHQPLLTMIALSAGILVVITGHLGATITHGENFLLSPFQMAGSTPNVLIEEAMVYPHMVQPILKAKCIACHSEAKAKGELVMQPFASLVKGGKSGAPWDPGKLSLGLMMERIHLPREHKKHMPPNGKPQLTEDEISILYNWIKTGAKPSVSVLSLPTSDTLRQQAAKMFTTIETASYEFEPADETLVKKLNNNYRHIAPVAQASPALTVDFFSAAQFRPEQLQELLQVKNQVVSLNLNKMPVTDADLAVISRFTNLRRLNLSFTDIRGTGLAALQQLTELRQLSLSGTGVTASHLSPLRSLRNLSQLQIWNTPAREVPLQALQSQFKNTQIETGFYGDSILLPLNSPLIESDGHLVIGTHTVTMKNYISGVQIRYTTDGTEPDSTTSSLFTQPLKLTNTVTLKARAFKPGWQSSEIVTSSFFKATGRIDSLWLLPPGAAAAYKKYPSSILFDAAKGEMNVRSGKWIGFYQYPMQAILYFEKPPTLKSVSIGNLVDINGSIFPPRLLQVWAGEDTAHFRLIKTIRPTLPPQQATTYTQVLEITFPSITEKYIKVIMQPLETLPTWHRKKGEPAFVVADEIFIN